MGPDFLGGNRGRMNANTTERQARFMKASTLAVHANPSVGSNCLTTTGYIIPPAEFPVVVSPIARPRLLLKYVATSARDGVKKIPLPIPVRTPWVNIRDQYWVEILMRNMPSTWIMAPTRNVGRNRPASNRRPTKTLMKRQNQIWTEPIHDIVDGDWGKVDEYIVWKLPKLLTHPQVVKITSQPTVSSQLAKPLIDRNSDTKLQDVYNKQL